MDSLDLVPEWFTFFKTALETLGRGMGESDSPTSIQANEGLKKVNASIGHNRRCCFKVVLVPFLPNNSHSGSAIREMTEQIVAKIG